MKNNNSVLVGVDYSEPSDNAIREAARLAAWDGTQLVAVNILDERTLERAKDEIKLDEARMIEAQQRRLDRHIEAILGPGHGVRCEFLVGHPFRGMVTLCEQFHIGLIVLGSHGLVDDNPYRVGTLATRCIRKAKPNVLLVRDWQEGAFRRVCACIDFSENSREAAGSAVRIARQDVAELDFLHVHLPMTSLLGDPGFLMSEMPTAAPEQEAEVVRSMDEKLKVFGAEVADGYQHETHVVTSSLLRAGIIDYLESSSPDLVVLNTRGHTAIRNLLIGAAAEKIIHEVNCSTLVVKPAEFGYTLD
ncbi:MAG: universal stress protein E [Verrucomicrobiales bacterium]|jgi:universal stress protein E